MGHSDKGGQAPAEQAGAHNVSDEHAEMYSVYARLKSRPGPARRAALSVLLPMSHAALNFLAIGGSFYLAYLLDKAGCFDFMRLFQGERPMVLYLLLSVVVGAATVGLSAFVGAYRRYDTLMNLGAKTKLLASFAVVTVAMFVVDLFARIEVSRIIYAVGAGLAVFALVMSCNLYALFTRLCHVRGLGVRRVAIVGVNPLGRMVARKLFQQPGIGFVPIGFLADEADQAEGRVGPVLGDAPELPVLGTKDQIERIIAEQEVQDVIVARPAMSNELFVEFLRWQERYGVGMHFVPPLSILAFEFATTENLDGLPLIRLRPTVGSTLFSVAKRAMDVVLSAVLIVLTLPLMVVIALLVKLTSKGPLIFRQKRVGRGGKPFTILKFRTMYADTPAYAETPRLATDPRVTPLGRFLRHFDLDELPQLFSVLLGRMSMVGPRPEMPQIVEGYNELQKLRLSMKPGMTGLWQLSPDRNLPIHENLDYDLYYIENRSVILDIIILIDTLLYLIARGVSFLWLAGRRTPSSGARGASGPPGQSGASSPASERGL